MQMTLHHHPSTSSTSFLPSAKFTPNPSTASVNSSRDGLAVTLGVVCTVFFLVISSIWWFLRRGQHERREDDDYDYPRTRNDDNFSPQMSDINAPHIIHLARLLPVVEMLDSVRCQQNKNPLARHHMIHLILRCERENKTLYYHPHLILLVTINLNT